MRSLARTGSRNDFLYAKPFPLRNDECMCRLRTRPRLQRLRFANDFILTLYIINHEHENVYIYCLLVLLELEKNGTGEFILAAISNTLSLWFPLPGREGI